MALTLLLGLAVTVLMSLLAATIGAAIWPVPIIGLPALVLLPFPTFALYLGATVGVYLAIVGTLRLRGREQPWDRWAVLVVGFVAPIVAGILYPLGANWHAGIANIDAAAGWSPLRLARHQTIVLVTIEKDPDLEHRCDAFCLSLLATGKATEVIVARSASQIDRGAVLSGMGYRLAANWQRCLRDLPDYLSVVRQYPEDRLRQMIDFGLDPYFDGRLPDCLAKRPVGVRAGTEPTLAIWRGDASAAHMDADRIGWRRPHAEQRILVPGGSDRNRRLLRYGIRYAVPAMIWPYGGNAGSGGTFSPKLARVTVSTESASARVGPTWWDMVEDGEALAASAIAVLDPLVTDRQCLPPPVPAYCEGNDAAAAESFDNRAAGP
ncbi:MAG: hypothetical protein A4S16_08240 [Proteobacteria bacterium SG_bin6]|nr:MAG: hypothetical protein A4S16_08240 [Proteobacteria bacterium SG_bin6]